MGTKEKGEYWCDWDKTWYVGNDNFPINYVGWNKCVEFTKKLSELTGETFELPTEAEWEYAAGGGNRTTCGYGWAGFDGEYIDYEDYWSRSNLNFRVNDLHHSEYKDGKVNNIFRNRAVLKEVKSSDPNELGIYEMSGNAMEMCSDWYDKSYYKKSPIQDPKGPEKGKYKVVRGGSYYSNFRESRISDRDNIDLKHAYGGYSFRLKMVKK